MQFIVTLMMTYFFHIFHHHMNFPHLVSLCMCLSVYRNTHPHKSLSLCLCLCLRKQNVNIFYPGTSELKRWLKLSGLATNLNVAIYYSNCRA